MVLLRRVSHSLAGRFERVLFRPGVEDAPQNGLCGVGLDAERQGLAIQPGDREHSGKFRFHGVIAQAAGDRRF